MENTVNSRQRNDKAAKASKWSTQFLAFAETKSLLDIMDRSEKNPKQPDPSLEERTGAKTTAHNLQIEAESQAQAQHKNFKKLPSRLF